YAAVGGSNSGEGSGVYGHSTTRNGVWAVAEGEYAAVAAESQSSGTGVYAYSAEGFGGVFATDAADVCAVYAVAAEGSPSNPGLYVDGYATITGGVSSTMLTSAGLARAHSISSPQAEFSFSGSARLSAGEAGVAFASTWQDCISGAADYRVLITPTEMCNGICCVEKTPSGFKVRELAKGTSSASFDWMVRAVQKGSSTEKILLSGAGRPDAGMEIIEPERVKLLQAGIEKQKRMQASQSPDLASARPSAGASVQAGAARKTSPEMGPHMKRVTEYRERLKQRAQDR
ncbi:MAG: hypothetical protein JXQ83_06835, partial [Candidatus Glassbacteria bacterium]|nr:hypothetical protein [Candidatus Glassbacteria bacterium]